MCTMLWRPSIFSSRTSCWAFGPCRQHFPRFPGRLSLPHHCQQPQARVQPPPDAKVKFLVLLGLTMLQSASAGQGHHTCFILDTRQVMYWGRNNYYQRCGCIVIAVVDSATVCFVQMSSNQYIRQDFCIVIFTRDKTCVVKISQT